MAAAPILKIVFSYLEVLQTVKNCRSLTWDEKSFTNALSWAEFCRKIYLQSRNKSYISQLNDEIKKLLELPWNLDGLKLDLNVLGDSFELLIIVFLYNKNIKLDLFKLKKLLDLLKSKENKSPIKTYVENLLELKLMMSGLERNDGGYKNDILQRAVKALIQFFMHFSTSFIYTKKYILEEILIEISLTKHGCEIIEALYKSLNKLKHCTTNARMKENTIIMDMLFKSYFMHNWDFLSKHKTFVRVLECNNYLIVEFLNIFFSLGKRFHIRYKDKNTHEFPLFLWTVKDVKENNNLCYDWLKEWTTFLLCELSEKVICMSEDRLSVLSSSSDVNVWRSVCQELYRTDLFL